MVLHLQGWLCTLLSPWLCPQLLWTLQSRAAHIEGGRGQLAAAAGQPPAPGASQPSEGGQTENFPKVTAILFLLESYYL